MEGNYSVHNGPNRLGAMIVVQWTQIGTLLTTLKHYSTAIEKAQESYAINHSYHKNLSMLD